jgi:hypothetical protein
MSLEDAYHLAKHLATAPRSPGGSPAGGPAGWLAGADVAAALAAFRAERLPRVSRIMANAQVQGAAGYQRSAGAGRAPPPVGAPGGGDWSEYLYRLDLPPLAGLQAPAAAAK